MEYNALLFLSTVVDMRWNVVVVNKNHWNQMETWKDINCNCKISRHKIVNEQLFCNLTNKFLCYFCLWIGTAKCFIAQCCRMYRLATYLECHAISNCLLYICMDKVNRKTNTWNCSKKNLSQKTGFFFVLFRHNSY